MKIVIFTISLLLVGCANPGIVHLSPDTYMLSRSDMGGIFGNAAAMKADVINEASEFAMKQGKIAIPLSVKEVPVGFGRLATIEYQFRVVDKNDPEARRVSLVPRADVVIETKSTIKADIETKTKTNKSKDVYAELIKLDDLLKRKIITKSEFTNMKKKLLSGN